MSLNDFVRPDAALVAQYRDVAKCYSASCVFADVLEAAREQADREEPTRQRIREGRSFEQLLEEFGRI